jgi:hypothetical protein
MTPFIVWLTKQEIDDMLFALLNKKNSNTNDKDVLDSDDLLSFAQDLITQNNKFINLFEKIEPLNPLNKKAAQNYGVEQKCKHFHSELERMELHCSIHNNTCGVNFKEFSEMICFNCAKKSDTLFSNN